MDDYKLSVGISKKGSDEVNEKTININLQEYQNSYQKNATNLQEQYTKSEINKMIRPLKEQYIFDNISRNLNDNEELDSLIDPLVDEVDTYIIENNKNNYY